jgi:peptidoglycan/xylan/chitin deacetylase (PgdA/CDA1 family)
MAGDDLLNICFHGVGTPGRELEPGEDAYWVEADRFLRILDEIATWPRARISFDDGNASDVQVGLPALVERGLVAQFFPLAGRLGAPGSLAPGDVRELASEGMEIGTHGMWHRTWRGMDATTRTAELVEARSRIADAAGVAVVDAACPLGRYDRTLLSDLRQLGYRRVYTSDRQAARPAGWLQPRFSVRHGDTPESLRADVLTRPDPAKVAKLKLVGLVKRLR